MRVEETLDLDEITIGEHRIQPVVRVSFLASKGYVSGSVVPVGVRVDGESFDIGP